MSYFKRYFCINECCSDVYDQLSHGGSVGDFSWFTFFDESGDEGFDDGVVLGGADGGHVEGFADFGATGMDTSQALFLSAVAVVGCEAG